MRSSARLRAVLAALCLLGPGCSAEGPTPSVPVVYEAKPGRRAETDSVAVYRTGAKSGVLFATEKLGHTVAMFDAISGKLLGRLGGRGEDAGQLLRPNGIAVVDVPVAGGGAKPVLMVVERDGRRVQAFSLPQTKPIGTFGRAQFRMPYGIAACPAGGDDAAAIVFVTDAGAKPTQRVRRFRVSLSGGRVVARHERSFGDAEGPGVLAAVESIAADADYKRLYVCDESSAGNVKVYSLDGDFLGKTFGDKVIRFEAEGIAVWRKGKGGCIVVADQAALKTQFRVFDRVTLKYVGTFTSQIANTDGICLVARPLGQWKQGVLYAVHNDGPVRACAWADIVKALALK